VTRALKAMVVDDREDGRVATASAVTAAGLKVVATSGHSIGLADLVARHKPQVIFVAAFQPLERPLNTISFLAELGRNRAIIAYSRSDDTPFFQQVIRAGARHLLPSPVTADDVARAVSHLDFRRRGRKVRVTGRVLAVVGQKGGIGKTAISVNIASSLANDSKNSVLIIDFDTTFGDVGLAMDIDTHHTAARAAAYLDSLDREAFKEKLVEHDSGAFVLPAPPQFGEWLAVEPEALERLVHFTSEFFDYVIVDTPGAYNDAVASAISVADHLFIVTNMERSSVKNTRLLLEVLQEEDYPDERILVIANHTVGNSGIDVTEVAPQLGRHSIWEIPFDSAMRLASQEGRPIVLWNATSRSSQSLRTLAGRLATEPDNIERRKEVRAARVPEPISLRDRLRGKLGLRLAKAS
jgi:pilus assembly protein CpaE